MSTKDKKPDVAKPHFVRVVSSVAANTFTVFENIVINPSQSSTVNLYVTSGNATDTVPPPTRPVDLSDVKWLTRGIFLAAILCLLLQVGLGFAWPEPTVAQAIIMGTVDWGWKMGFGFAVGLMTGKSVL